MLFFTSKYAKPVSFLSPTCKFSYRLVLAISHGGSVTSNIAIGYNVIEK